MRFAASLWVALTVMASTAAPAAETWVPFNPPPDPFSACPLDLRGLNEAHAGAHGRIAVKGGQFVWPQTGQPVRFWGVNGLPDSVTDKDSLQRAARLLAKRGVNLLRLQLRCFDQLGNFRADSPQRLADVVSAMKAEGIYTHVSVYFPMWLLPAPDCDWLKGYDGATAPFAALFFNPALQTRYQDWWKTLLTTASVDGRPLLDEPALLSAELVDEDSFFFWTFNPDSLPLPQLALLETQFGTWLKREFGSLEAAAARWEGVKCRRDDFAAGRVGFRPLLSIIGDRGQRDADTVKFLALTQRGFYQQALKALRDLGFKGLITCSNWTTAGVEVLGPVEKWTYTAGDFIDRHSYYGCSLSGPGADGTLREEQTWYDRSALRCDADVPGPTRQYLSPAMDPHYDDKPSMLSETGWSRPNRYRSEAPLFLACYGALQDSQALVHFGVDTLAWTTKSGFFQQPWTLMSPAMLGQFPAAAYLYRRGLIDPGEPLVRLNLKLGDVLGLRGTPLPQDFAFDDTRVAELPTSIVLKKGNIVDPLSHYVGQTAVTFSEAGGFPSLRDSKKFINRVAGTVTSTHGQLKLDYAKGLLVLNAPQAQGALGNLAALPTVECADLTLASTLKLEHVVAISLDGQPLSRSARLLVQAMTEEQPTGFESDVAPAPVGARRIVNLGRDPWTFRPLEGKLRFKRADAARLVAQPLDFNGYPVGEPTTGETLTLRPDILYYLVTLPGS